MINIIHVWSLGNNELSNVNFLHNEFPGLIRIEDINTYAAHHRRQGATLRMDFMDSHQLINHQLLRTCPCLRAQGDKINTAGKSANIYFDR